MAAVIAPVAVLAAVAADATSSIATSANERSAAEATPCCMALVATAPSGVPADSSAGEAAVISIPRQQFAASRWRIVDRELERRLPAGVAPERGLQVKTILAARSISAIFPEIHNIGGVRPDGLRWHPNGLALDVMIPDPGTAQGIALGNQIVSFVIRNADRLAINHVIWRGTFFTKNGALGSASGHYDHVHVATNGGGYPTGSETYVR